MNDDKRYHTRDDPETGVTQDELSKLDRREQLKHLLHWFHRNFEDPANETPHDSEEGYQFIWGGPYDAAEELNEEFEGVVPDDVLEEAIANVQRAGHWEWAPGPDHPDHARAAAEWAAQQGTEDERELENLARILEEGQRPTYGVPSDARGRDQIREDINSIQETIRSARPHVGIGHNNPPPDEEEVKSALTDIGMEGEIIRAELEKAEPVALVVAKAALGLKKAWRYLLTKLDLAVDTLVKVSVTGIVGVVVLELSPKIQTLAQHVIEWLSNVTLPF